MIEYDTWFSIYKDEEINIRKNPECEGEFGISAISLVSKLEEPVLILPRGTLKEIALANRLRGKQIMENLSPYYLGELSLINPKLNSDSLIAAATKAYILEEKVYNEFLEKYK